MRTSIDDIIDVISSDMPEFLDPTKLEDQEAFNYVSYLILVSKVLCVDMSLGMLTIIKFTDDFFDKLNRMMNYMEDEDKCEKCYEYVTQFYNNLFLYLEENEEYEMCSNFRNFINEFNDKVDSINNEL